MSRPDLSTVKAGDPLLLVFDSGRSSAEARHVVVERLTPTQVVLTDGTRYRLTDGEEVGRGKDYRRRPYLVLTDDSDGLRALARRRWRLAQADVAASCRALDRYKLTRETAEEALARLERGAATLRSLLDERFS